MICMWIGIDDTDSRIGGCTTYVAFHLIQRLIKNGFSIIGFPRLVRLNPNIPWKTRGNGAVAVQIGVGAFSSDRMIGFKDNQGLMSGDVISSGSIDFERVKSIVCDLVEEFALFDEENTNPGIVISKEQLPNELYWNAIRKVVTVDEIVEQLDTLNTWYKGYKNRRGLIGASAALSWNDTFDRTFEIIKYRLEKRWGTKRIINESSVKMMNDQCPSTFDNYDALNQHISIAPNSPCPVLFGIRGDDNDVLPYCSELIESETAEGWLIFMSNQATDDHLQVKSIHNIEPFQSVISRGIVTKKPVTIPGGHVIFSLHDDSGMIDCAAYEPTKEFRKMVRQLERGDEVSVYGGVRSHPLTINIEKIQIHHLVDIFEKIENPVCPQCGRHMKSKGKDQGFICKRCKTFEKQGIFEKKSRSIVKGFYEVPVCARRHLSKPLKRMRL